jgi:acetyl esterase
MVMIDAKGPLGWLARNDGESALGLMMRLSRPARTSAIDNFWLKLATWARKNPMAQPHRHDVELIRDVPYLNSGSAAHQLDIYRPTTRPGPWPVIINIHGGGFRILSKDTHWLMGLMFARRGYLVFNINYRLAPEHRYPAAVQDACAALRWVARNAGAFGGDLGNLVISGESAGANLALALAIATTFRRPEPWAQQIYDLGVVPRAVVPFCGILQVSDVDRHVRAGLSRGIGALAVDYIRLISEEYLPVEPDAELSMDLADPLLFLESDARPERPLPAVYIPVGTRDPLLDDSRRLAIALEKRRADVEAKYYDGEHHAFHALIWRSAARRCWRDTFEFLAHRLEGARRAERPAPVVPLRSRARLRST